MSGTRLRTSALSGWPCGLLGPCREEDGLGSSALMAKPVLRNFLATAALTLIACGIVISSLVAAPGASGFFGAALGLLMLAIAMADARAYIIPDRLTLAALLLALAETPVHGFENMPENMALAVLRGLVLALGFLALRDIYYRLRQRQGIGLGDVKLAAVAGAWLDWPLIPAAIEIAAVLALIVYIASQLVLRQPFRATAKMPFGVFFAPAIWFCWLLGALFLQA
jgi:leader peptidase (prepilin peptidase)/N-methyltransferase